jgi:putative molybdopterin biosynthesis protein
MMNSPSSIPHNADQEQFLTILSREEALARFQAALFPRPVPSEERVLAEALGLALAQDVTAQVDVPPFDRSNVDGFAVRATDLAAASELHPVRLRLNAETIACGHAPQLAVLPGTATAIATGGPLPRGADAISLALTRYRKPGVGKPHGFQ